MAGVSSGSLEREAPVSRMARAKEALVGRHKHQHVESAHGEGAIEERSAVQVSQQDLGRQSPLRFLLEKRGCVREGGVGMRKDAHVDRSHKVQDVLDEWRKRRDGAAVSNRSIHAHICVYI